MSKRITFGEFTEIQKSGVLTPIKGLASGGGVMAGVAENLYHWHDDVLILVMISNGGGDATIITDVEDLNTYTHFKPPPYDVDEIRERLRVVDLGVKG